MLAGLGTWLLVLAPLVRFAPTGVTCPSAAEVEAQLATLLAPSVPETSLPDVITLDRDGSTLRVSVHRPDGSIVGRRMFEGSYPCADLASAVALTIATWESDVHPEFVFAPPAAEEPRPPPAPVPSAAVPPLATAIVVPARPEQRPAPRSPLGFDLGAALITLAAPRTTGGSVDAGLALGLGLVGAVAQVPGGWGARVALGASTERAVPVAGGEARWRRATAALGGLWRLRFGDLSGAAPAGDPAPIIDVHADVALAALQVRGVGLPANDSSWSADLGGAAGARIWLGRGHWRPSIELGLTFWPRTHIAYANPVAEGARLPRVDVHLALGLSFVNRLTQGDGPR